MSAAMTPITSLRTILLLGAALFGVAGAFLAVPVTAMLLALLEIYGKRYELISDPSTEGTEGPAER